MSSTEVVVSPTKKKTKQQKMDQTVSSVDSVTNGCNKMNNDDINECNNGDEESSKTTLINNLNDTNNKESHVECMEPLLIQDCVSDENNFVVTNTINSYSCDEGGGGREGDGDDETYKPPSNLTLNLASSDNMPKNKKFLDSSEDQIMNQIFFQTISVTPTADDIEDILNSQQFVTSDSNTPLTPNLDFFNRKIEEDEAFDMTYTDTVDNYQLDENHPNLCSLNDNFNENYCSFSSIDYNTTNVHYENNSMQQDEDGDDLLLQPDKFLGDYAEQMRHQRPSIVIDCYDDSDNNSNEVVEKDTGDAKDANNPEEGGKIKDYCFYFDQTIEEDDDVLLDDGSGEGDDDNVVQLENGKTLDKELQGEEYLESDDYGNEDPTNEDCEEEEKSATSDEDDEGVINESKNSTLESFESESTVVKKTVKKSVKSSSKTTTKKKTVSEETSSITTSSSKAESFENSFSNGSLEMVEHQESITSSKSIDTSTSSNGIVKEQVVGESIGEPQQLIEGVGENGVGGETKKKGTIGKKRPKKKRSDEKENISVNVSEVTTSDNEIDVKANNIRNSLADASPTASPRINQKFIIPSNYQLHEDDLSRIDVKSLKQKYSNAVEKHHQQSMKSSSGVSTEYLGIRKDFSVKHLCRSFGDLSSLNSEEYNNNYFQHVYRTKSTSDLRKVENIYTGVSVRNLRDSYCSLIGLTSSNLHQQHQPHSLTHIKQSNNRGKTINLGIKQFDMKSSFSKFDALQKKNLQSVQNGENGVVNPAEEKKCHACDKVVFQMEQIKAEKKFWHRTCFRCNECSKQLNVDTYQSHEGVLYCKPHFKSLFAPKIVEESTEPVKPRKLEMIILENQPIELPPDVVRSSDKSDLGLDELHQIDLRQRFQLFENGVQQDTKVELEKANSVKRSTSILSKLARFQSKGMDVGIVDDSLNGVCYEHSSSGSEGEEDEEDMEELDENHEDIELIRAKRASRKKEKPCSFKEMNDIKSKFESGQLMTKDGHREERKQELQNIRSRLFMGKQAKIKEMYQQAVAESEQTITSAEKIKKEVEIGDKAKSIKERFENGEIFEENDMRKTLKEDEMAVFEQGIGKQSRSLFLELDASNAAKKSSSLQESPSMTKVGNHTPHTPRQNSQTVVSSDDIVRSDAKMEDVQIETADILSKFKFFETYKPPEKEKKSFRITPPRDYQGLTKLPSPEKEVYRDPHIARNEKEKRTDQDEILELQKTTSKMLSMFRQLEEKKEDRPYGPKPLKRFTPPPEGEKNKYAANEESDPEYSDEEYSDEEYSDEEEEEQNPDYVKSSHKNVDEFLKAAQSAERAKKLREKFEKWEENEIKKEMNNSSVNLYEEATDEGQMETAKSLRARFEQMQKEEPKLPTSASRIKVNRFV